MQTYSTLSLGAQKLRRSECSAKMPTWLLMMVVSLSAYRYGESLKIPSPNIKGDSREDKITTRKSKPRP